MAVIFALGSDVASAEHTSRLVGPMLTWLLPGAGPSQLDALNGLVRKLAHFTEYAILGGLWFRAFTRGSGRPAGTAAWTALAVSVAWAALDEGHQLFVSSRTASLGDVALDAGGAAAAVLAVASGWPQAVRVVTGATLWIAAAGGTVVLIVNSLVGVPSGLLWLTAPAAALVLVLRRRTRRSLRL
jgi:VanZ family protein